MMTVDDARSEVDGWLDQVKLRTGKCSSLLRQQLAVNMVARTIDVFAVYDELDQLEGSDPARRTGTKKAEPLGHGLKGLMHKHYKQAGLGSFYRNMINHWEKRENQRELWQLCNEFNKDGHAGKFAHGLVLRSHERRHAESEMTGEWIVYARIAGANYYLTLGGHGESEDAVIERVRSCFGEFPQLRQHLGW
jgi:hypothetical protein